MAVEQIGLLHPGEMGAGIGAVLVGAGHTVNWASSGRSPSSARRAGAAGLVDLGSVDALTRSCRIILSVCPPAHALDVAEAVAGFDGLYVDANAIAPATAQRVATVIEASGGRYVDGGIIGGPPTPTAETPTPTAETHTPTAETPTATAETHTPTAETHTPTAETHLYLSGPSAQEASQLFAGTTVDVRVLAGDPTAASAIKMCFAAWTKGSAALLLDVRALAVALGIEGPLLDAWRRSIPELGPRSVSAARSAATKGWRWTGEMEEIAATFRSAGLPDGFHAAAAEIYGRVDRDERAVADTGTLRSVIEALNG